MGDNCKTEAKNDGIFCFVDDLIDLARLESGVEVNEMRISGKFATHGVRKTQLAARNRSPQTVRRIAHRQDILRTCGVIDRIAFSAGWSEKGMAERHVVNSLGGRKIRTHQAMDFFSPGIVGDR